MNEALIDVLKWQGAACTAMGSPFSGDLLERASAALAEQPTFQAHGDRHGRRVADS